MVNNGPIEISCNSIDREFNPQCHQFSIFLRPSFCITDIIIHLAITSRSLLDPASFFLALPTSLWVALPAWGNSLSSILQRKYQDNIHTHLTTEKMHYWSGVKHFDDVATYNTMSFTVAVLVEVSYTKFILILFIQYCTLQTFFSQLYTDYYTLANKGVGNNYGQGWEVEIGGVGYFRDLGGSARCLRYMGETFEWFYLKYAYQYDSKTMQWTGVIYFYMFNGGPWTFSVNSRVNHHRAYISTHPRP